MPLSRTPSTASAQPAAAPGPAAGHGGRTDLALLEDTLHGLRAWKEVTDDVRAEARRIGQASREARMDAQRRLAALQRSQEALLVRLDGTLQASVGALGGGPRTALVAHRNAWMRGKLVEGLGERGFVVVAEVEDGADGLGAVLAEQPDVLVVEDLLPSLEGAELIRQVRRVAPRTFAAAQVGDDRGVEAMVDAGAQAVFSRRVPPATLCQQVAELLSGTGGTRPLLLL